MTTVTQTRTDAGLATALRISVSRLARRLRAQRTTSGLTEAVLSETQLAALSALEAHQAMTPGELAEHEKVQPPSMTRVIAVLEERNLVLRSPHPTDRRQVVLTVTEEGRALVQRVRRRKDAWLARRLSLVAVQRGHQLGDVGGHTAPGQGQVRLEAAALVGRRRASAARARGDGFGQPGQGPPVTGQAAPQHVRPGGGGEGAGARERQPHLVMPPGGALEARQQPGRGGLVDLAQEGQGHVP